MFRSIFDDFVKELKFGNRVSQLLIINVCVFLLIIFIKLGFKVATPEDGSHYSNFINHFMFTTNLKQLIFQPWTIISSIFTHEAFGHIFWNMIIMYMMGNIAGNLLGNQRILPIYIYGGLFGLLVLTIANLIFNHNVTVYALGASGSIMALAFAAATTSPDYSVRLFLFGEVKLKYIVGIYFILDLVSIGNFNMFEGGSFAHIGGAIFGVVFVKMLYNGHDWSKGFNSIFDKIAQIKSPLTSSNNPYKKGNVVQMQVTKKTDNKTQKTGNTLTHEEKLDFILEKISKSGMSSLTEKEQDFLKEASK
jgi:membrane associated rhomboid family serine protease